MNRLWCLLAFCGFAGVLRAGEAWEAAKEVLSERCTKCHGGVKHKGGLDLRAVPNILMGGDSGPAVVAGKPTESLLIEVLQPDSDVSMPPKGERLTETEIAAISAWIVSLNEEAEASPTGALLAPDMPPHVVIDFLVARGWANRQVMPSQRIDDAGFVRRAYLDLLGRIPTVEERRLFLTKARSDKRAALVDDLLGHSEFARNFAEIFDTVLMGRRHGLVGRARALDRGGDWHAYLKWVFASNRRWDDVAYDLLEARATEGEERGARWFLVGHKDNHEDMVRQVGPSLLGKQIACAQCHNHPLIPEIEQRHYWGLVAFFKRSFNVETPNGLALGEAATGGQFEFSSLEGDSFQAELAFLSGQTAEEETNEAYRVMPSQEYLDRLNKKEKDRDKEKKAKKKRKGPPKMERAPIPVVSRREALAQLAIESYPEFSKAFVNRIWALLLGRGLVHPVDHLDSIHPPSHPELLEWLGQNFASHHYDIKRLIREIMASRVYQLDSLPSGSVRPAPEAFACAMMKPLSAEALYRSALVAGGHVPDDEGNFSGIDEERYRHAFARVYSDLFPETFSPSAAEGLFFSNNPLMKEILVRDFAERAPHEVAEIAFISAFGREPDDEERAASLTYVNGDPGRPASLLWSLIAGSEFRFNH